ncbi:MAG: hypothetical protein OEV92_09020 [Nitrospinota bacterium]|nr:hypothetical protein [Nitrospinota bacterium]
MSNDAIWWVVSPLRHRAADYLTLRALAPGAGASACMVVMPPPYN